MHYVTFLKLLFNYLLCKFIGEIAEKNFHQRASNEKLGRK